jgi:acid phosphatase (class A)
MTHSYLNIRQQATSFARKPGSGKAALLIAGLFAMVVASTLLSSSPATAKAARNSLLWLQPDSIDFTRELGAPPASNTPAAQADMDAIISITKARTPEREALAIEDARQTLVRFLEGMDIDISKKQTSEARGLFKEINTEMEILLHRFKLQYDRRRPFQANKKTVKACAKNQPRSSSYPSSHAATGSLFAAILTEAAPEMKARFEARGEAYAESRTICGFHYPTDTQAGLKAGKLIAAALMANKPFKTRYSETRTEIRSALGL